MSDERRGPDAPTSFVDGYNVGYNDHSQRRPYDPEKAYATHPFWRGRERAQQYSTLTQSTKLDADLQAFVEKARHDGASAEDVHRVVRELQALRRSRIAVKDMGVRRPISFDDEPCTEGVKPDTTRGTDITPQYTGSEESPNACPADCGGCAMDRVAPLVAPTPSKARCLACSQEGCTRLRPPCGCACHETSESKCGVTAGETAATKPQVAGSTPAPGLRDGESPSAREGRGTERSSAGVTSPNACSAFRGVFTCEFCNEPKAAHTPGPAKVVNVFGDKVRVTPAAKHDPTLEPSADSSGDAPELPREDETREELTARLGITEAQVEGYMRQFKPHLETPSSSHGTELDPLAQRIAKGRAKYPNGCTFLSLIDEAGEAAHAVNKYEPEDRVRDELLDVAAVAMRLYFGEIDRGLETDGLVQRRKPAKNPPQDPEAEAERSLNRINRLRGAAEKGGADEKQDASQ